MIYLYFSYLHLLSFYAYTFRQIAKKSFFNLQKKAKSCDEAFFVSWKITDDIRWLMGQNWGRKMQLRVTMDDYRRLLSLG